MKTYSKRTNAIHSPIGGINHAEYVRAFARDLHGGEEPDWLAIAGTLFKAGFETLARAKDDDRRRAYLLRLHERSYKEAMEGINQPPR